MKRLPQGVKSGSIAFQSMINTLFRKMLFKYMLAYTDDVIVFSQDTHTHLTQHLPKIFAILRKANLKLHSRKCQFATKTCKFLGNVITSDGFTPCPTKVAAIANYSPCKNTTELRQFLGVTGYYRRYIFNYAKVAHCLTRLLQKDAKWVWHTEHQEAFTELKRRLVNAPVIAYPDFSRDFYICTDASTSSIGHYLFQLDDKNQERVICFGGRNLRQGERCWNIAELEGLAIVDAVRNYSAYISDRKTVIYCDNISMQWLNTIKNANGRLLRL